MKKECFLKTMTHHDVIYPKNYFSILGNPASLTKISYTGLKIMPAMKTRLGIGLFKCSWIVQYWQPKAVVNRKTLLTHEHRSTAARLMIIVHCLMCRRTSGKLPIEIEELPMLHFGVARPGFVRKFRSLHKSSAERKLGPGPQLLAT